MKPYIIYFRQEELYNRDPGYAAYVDSFLADRILDGCQASAYTVDSDNKFSTGSKYIKIKSEPCEAVLIGTIPYYLLVSNLYRLEEEGFTVYIAPEFIRTEKNNPEYPQEFVREWSVSK